MPRDARAKAREAEIKTLNPAVTPKHTLLSDRAPADGQDARHDRGDGRYAGAAVVVEAGDGRNARPARSR